MTFQSHVEMKMEYTLALPRHFSGPDERLPECFVEYALERFSNPGAVVFDPFAGFGTTLAVAESLGRVGYGTEIEPERAEFARRRLSSPERLLTADVRDLLALELPPFDVSLSSPPYMQIGDAEDPLSGYLRPGRGYDTYVTELAGVYASLRGLMKPGARLLIEVANLRREGVVTPLAWDLGRALGDVFSFEGEIVICWDRYGFGYEHSYCLVYR